MFTAPGPMPSLRLFCTLVIPVAVSVVIPCATRARAEPVVAPTSVPAPTSITAPALAGRPMTVPDAAKRAAILRQAADFFTQQPMCATQRCYDVRHDFVIRVPARADGTAPTLAVSATGFALAAVAPPTLPDCLPPVYRYLKSTNALRVVPEQPAEFSYCTLRVGPGETVASTDPRTLRTHQFFINEVGLWRDSVGAAPPNDPILA
jgi:hypothetical protein